MTAAGRLLREVELLRAKYPLIEHGPGIDWLLFSGFPLPPGWNRESIDLLLLVPAGYPEVPPDNFYAENGLRTAADTLPDSYKENNIEVNGRRWARFSYHAGRWAPLADPVQGDSLATFMLAVEQRLREAN